MVLTNKVEQHPRRQPAFMQGERRIVQRSQSCYRAWNAGWPVGRSRECSERCLLQRTLDSASCMCDLPLLVDAHVAGAYQYQFPGKPRIRLSDRSAMRGVRFNSLSDNAHGTSLFTRFLVFYTPRFQGYTFPFVLRVSRKYSFLFNGGPNRI